MVIPRYLFGVSEGISTNSRRTALAHDNVDAARLHQANTFRRAASIMAITPGCAIFCSADIA